MARISMPAPRPGASPATRPTAHRSATPITSAPPPTCAAALLMPDPRIDDRIADFDDTVRHEHAHDDDDDDALHHREVPAQDGVHQQDPDAGQGEDRLRHHRAARFPSRLDGHGIAERRRGARRGRVKTALEDRPRRESLAIMGVWA